MIVLVVDKHGITVLECKGQPPIATDRNRPMIGKAAFQWMKASARSTHVGGRSCHIQHRELQTKSISLARLNASGRSLPEKKLDSLVPEASDHAAVYSVPIHPVNVQGRSTQKTSVGPTPRMPDAAVGSQRECDLGKFGMEAWVGIEPAYAALQAAA